jgi:hypothetical protein
MSISRRSQWPRGQRRRSRPFGCWNRGFESHSGHGCLSLCLNTVLSCVGRGLCDGLITGPNESYHVSNKIRETSKERHGLIRAGAPYKKKVNKLMLAR